MPLTVPVPGQDKFHGALTGPLTGPLAGYAVAVASSGLAGACLLAIIVAFSAGPAGISILSMVAYWLAACLAFGVVGAPLTYASFRWIPPQHRSHPSGYIMLGQAVVLLIGVWPLILSTAWNSLSVWLLAVPVLCFCGAIAGIVFWRLSVRPAAAD